MKTKEEIEEKASEYVEDVKDRIDGWAYLDVQEAFQKGAEWMQEQVNGVNTSYDKALNLADVSQQRELLFAFGKYLQKRNVSDFTPQMFIDDFLSEQQWLTVDMCTCRNF